MRCLLCRVAMVPGVPRAPRALASALLSGEYMSEVYRETCLTLRVWISYDPVFTTLVTRAVF